MPQLNNLSRSLAALEQDTTLIAAIEMGQSSWLPKIALPAQPVDATQALNLSAGVLNPKVLRGRSFS